MISAVVLSRNDEENIERTLGSLAWCDEVLVVDDYSDDETATIAINLGATVYKRHLEDDFAAQRNYALRKARHPWVLFVDSDETVSPELAKEIRGIADTAILDNDPNGYYVSRRDYFLGTWLTSGETGRVRLLRLGRKDRGEWNRTVHETWDIEGRKGTLREPLLHYPHQDVAQFLDSINRYSTINADYLHKQGVIEPTWRIVVNPVGKFIHNYLIRAGFRDGMPGAIMAIMMSMHSFLTRGKLWMRWHAASSRSSS